MKNKLKHLKHVTDLQLIEKDLQVLYFLYKKTGKAGGVIRINTYDKDNIFEISGDELYWLLLNLNDNGLIDGKFLSKIVNCNISAKGIQLLRALEAEENKGCRAKFIDKTTRLKNFITILISAIALIVSIIALFIRN